MMDFSSLNTAVLDTFAEPVTIDGVLVDAVFDSRHYPVEDGEVGVSDLITTITVRTSELPPITDDTVFVARGVTYRRFETRPDGQGLTSITLERSA